MIVKKYIVVKKGRNKHTHKSVNVDTMREYYKMVHEL